MDASDLRVFEAVARLGGINRAARELNTVQSNVTNRIRILEQGLDTSLFERKSRGVTLTPAGQRLLPYAHRVLNLLEEARRAVVDEGIPRGPLALGSLETTAALHIAPFLAEYVATYPEVEVSLRTGTTCELVKEVLDYHLEGAFVCGPVAHPLLDEEVIFREELVIMAAPRFKCLEDILATKEVRIIVLRAGCSYRLRLEDFLAKRGVVGLRVLEFGTLEAVFGCVAAGLGITLLPKRLAGGVWDPARVATHPIAPEGGMVETVFIRRHGAYTSSALATFLEKARTLKPLNDLSSTQTH